MKFGLLDFGFAVLAASVSNSALAAPAQPSAPKMLQQPADFAAAIQELGYLATMDKDEDGDPMITSSSSGSRFFIMFSECEGNRKCQIISWYKGFTYDKSDYSKYKVISDRWNSKLWISKTALGEDTFHLAYSYDISGSGVTAENFKAVFERWAFEMDRLKNEFRNAE